MTEEQGDILIGLIEYQNEFLTDFAGQFAVEAFNVLSYIQLLALGIILALFIVSSLKKEKN